MSEKTNGFDGFEELTGMDQISAERLRRMKAMMRQIHQEEFETKKLQMRPIKGKTLILVVSFASLILFGVTALYNFNLLVTLEEKVLSTQGHLEYALQRRANLFGNLTNLALNQAALEREIFRTVNEGRAALSGRGESPMAPVPVDPPSVAESSPAVPPPRTDLAALTAKASLDRLLALVEQYPDIKVSGSYQKLMDKMVELEDRIAQRADEHNEQVRIYNTMITSYPWYVLAQMIGFKRYDYYHTNVRYEDYPQLNGDSYRMLLPQDRGIEGRKPSPPPPPPQVEAPRPGDAAAQWHRNGTPDRSVIQPASWVHEPPAVAATASNPEPSGGDPAMPNQGSPNQGNDGGRPKDAKRPANNPNGGHNVSQNTGKNLKKAEP